MHKTPEKCSDAFITYKLWKGIQALAHIACENRPAHPNWSHGPSWTLKRRTQLPILEHQTQQQPNHKIGLLILQQ